MTQPKHRPERRTLIVHAGDITESAVLPEWWGGLESDVESRTLRFALDGGNWMDEQELPGSLAAAGCRFSDVVGVMDFEGLANPALAVGRRVLLKPDPQPNDHFAIAVWVEDDSQQVGFLPSNVAADVMSESIRLRTGFGAFVTREVRDSKSSVRRDVTILLGPGVIWAEETAEGS